MRVASIGEILWDVIGPNEYLGGAPFNLCAHLVRLGHEAFFISAVGNDDRGQRTRQEIARHCIDDGYVQTTDMAPTGISQVMLDSGGEATHNFPRPAAFDFIRLDKAQRESLSASKPAWLCYGTLLQTGSAAFELTRILIEENPEAKRFYDVNLRPHCWTPELVWQLLGYADAVKLNEEESQILSALFNLPVGSIRSFCEALASNTRLTTACVTKGAAGCALWQNGEYIESPGFVIDVSDTVGSGDAFSAALLHGCSKGWTLAAIAEFANRVGALVASRPGATPSWTVEEAIGLHRRKA